MAFNGGVAESACSAAGRRSIVHTDHEVSSLSERLPEIKLSLELRSAGLPS